MDNFRGDLHVAQQSRRDKLRVQHQNSEHLEDHYNNLEQYPDLVQLRNLKYGTTSFDPTVFSSDVLSYVTKKNSHVLLPQNDQPLVSADKFPVGNLSHPNSSNLNISAAKFSGDPHTCSNWKSIGSQQGYDWVVNNYSSKSTSIHENNVNNALFVGGEGSVQGSLKGNNVSSPSFYMKQPNSYGYQDVVESSLVANPSGESSIIHQNSQRNFGGMQHCSGSQFVYQNTLQEVVTSATVGAQGEDMARYGGKDSNELLLLSSFGDTQSTHVRVCNNLGNWVNRQVEDFQTVRDQRMIADSSNAQGLSLSLSSVPLSNTPERQFGERNYSSDLIDSKALKSDYVCSTSRISIGSKVFGNTRQNIVGTSTIPHRNAVGPLGPFTGYATILKNSKYLKPTLQLLDELCGITGPNQIESLEMYSNKISEEAGVSSDHVVNAAESMIGAKGGESVISSSTFYSSNEISGEAGGPSSSNECYRPEYHQKKAKLLYMQEEVCRRYKQYHQQMQMVVSSFESVAGLSAATPYILMALKTVSRHFRCLKHAITDQLRHMWKELGEDLSSPTAGTSSSTKGDTSTSRLKFIDHGFQKQKSGGSNLVFFEPQQPVWRPQRGLPERAVAVLRAWLFDHFLHPYPTDTDKHMLATQTGLTRNQVSNWFINARVRVWKPMVEEIHILETKGSTEPISQTGKADGNPASENASHQYDNQPANKLSGIDPSRSREGPSAEFWNQDKRSRVECQIYPSMDGSLMSFLPYQRGGPEIGAGLGAVSLTLGLRQSAESAQQQQLQQQEHYRQHFGGQMIHDFVG